MNSFETMLNAGGLPHTAALMDSRTLPRALPHTTVHTVTHCCAHRAHYCMN
jgi:hypothetical protein